MNSTMTRLRARISGLLLACLLAACGGGGGGSSPTTPTTPSATPIPESLTLTAPTSAESATELQFGNSAASLSGLTFSWDFGDGKTSSDPSPKHSFAKGGDYEVLLKISNAAGASREQRVKLSITNLANVKGLVCSGANDGGWCWQQPQPTGNGPNNTYFLNASTVFTVGDNGELFRSKDAGASWSALHSGVTSSLRSIAFTSAQDGWILGDDGVLLRSSDGGSNWALSKIPNYFNAYSGPLNAIDAKLALLNDSRYTLDGGKTWAKVAFMPSFVSPKGVFWRMDVNGVTKSTDFGLSNVQVLDIRVDGYSLSNYALSQSDEGTLTATAAFTQYDMATSRYAYKQVLWRTTNGGASWTRTEPTGVSDFDSINTIRVVRASASDAVLLGLIGSGMVRSTDSGQTWKRVPASDDSAYFTEGYAGMLVVDKIILVPGFREMFRSADAGLTWTRSRVGTTETTYDTYTALRQVEGDSFSMLDSQGRAYLSADAGLTWKLAIGTHAGNAKRMVSSVSFLDSKHGLMLSPRGVLSETKDGGKTWAVKLPATADGSDLQLHFVNNTTGWMLTGDGNLYKTTDGAATWGSPIQLRFYGLSAIGFTNESLGWGRTRYGSANFLLTTDGGKSWADITAPVDAQGLYVLSAQQLIAYGANGTLSVSIDAGKTWTQRFARTGGLIKRATVSDGKVLWAAGELGLLMRSEDLGATWSIFDLGLQKESLNDIAFADARVGWVVGDRGTVFATIDGGKTWVRQVTGTARDLRRVMPIDAKTAWITGEYSTLLATGNGGF